MTSLLQLLVADARRALANALAKAVRWLDPGRASTTRDRWGNQHIYLGNGQPLARVAPGSGPGGATTSRDITDVRDFRVRSPEPPPRELPEGQCLNAQLVGTPHEPHEWPDPATDPWGAPTWCRGWPPRP